MNTKHKLKQQLKKHKLSYSYKKKKKILRNESHITKPSSVWFKLLTPKMMIPLITPMREIYPKIKKRNKNIIKK